MSETACSRTPTSAGLAILVLAALSLTFPVYFSLLAMGMGFSTGATALIGNALGRDDRAEAALTASQGLIMSVLLAVVITVGLFFLFRFEMTSKNEYLLNGRIFNTSEMQAAQAAFASANSAWNNASRHFQTMIGTAVINNSRKAESK